MTRDRSKAERAGRLAEAMAALWLTMKGYRIVARRVRTPVGEIDLVAMQRRPEPYGTLCLIEVKWRPTLDEALNALTVRQRQRLSRAAAAYLQSHPRHAAADLRYDVVLMAPGIWPRHLRDAWHD
jgi:putative endonuclease